VHLYLLLNVRKQDKKVFTKNLTAGRAAARGDSPQTLRLAGRGDGGGFTTNFTTLGQPQTPPRNTVGVL